MAAGIEGRKVAIIGCGFVGATSAFALMESGLFSEMVLIDVDRDRAEGRHWIYPTALPSPDPWISMQVPMGT